MLGKRINPEKKTLRSKFGLIQVPKEHVLCDTPSGFKMTPYWQNQCVYVGQAEVFEEGEQLIKRLTGQEVNAKQLERMVHHYGELAEHKIKSKETPEEKKNLHYAMMDGGMVLTREEAWKEMKLARIFSVKDHIVTGKSKNIIRNSQYIAHLGGHRDFLRKVEPITDELNEMVWIGDGAPWIWNWVSDTYPNSTQILDYFHTKERLCQLANEMFVQHEKREAWINEQENLLFENKLNNVLKNIEVLPCRGKTKQIQRTTLTYYENNRSRMKYKTYRDKGLLIGSGAIEAAHRHVVQKRLKRSGQRWTFKGAQQVVTLRTMSCSKQWNIIKNLICSINLN